MTEYFVTCLAVYTGDWRSRICATGRTFQTRELAEVYASRFAKAREAIVSPVTPEPLSADEIIAAALALPDLQREQLRRALATSLDVLTLVEVYKSAE